MRTLALTAALATALTGTGCIVSSAEPVGGDLDLAWQFEDYDGNLAGAFTTANTGCGVAAVTDVQLTVWDWNNRVVSDLNYGCVDNTGYPRAYLSNLAPGTYTWTAEAWRVDAPVFRASGTVNVLANQINYVDATLPVLTSVDVPLTVYFTQNGFATCASTPQIRFDIFFPSTAATPFESTTIPCAGSNYGYTAQANEPAGNTYGYDVYALDGGGVSWLNARCLVSVRHTGFPVTIDLVTAAASGCI